MRKDQDFTDLHVHSSYSLLDGAADPKEIVEATKKLGRKYLTLTDHGNVDGLIQFQKHCEKQDLLPLFGQELYMAEQWENRDSRDVKNLHMTVLAKDREGLAMLMRATGFAHNEGWSKGKRRPFLPMDYPLKNGWAGHFIIMTGCASSPFWNAANGQQLLRDYRDTFGADMYAELMPNEGFKPQNAINAAALNASLDLGIKPVTTTDIHYISKDDAEFHEVILGLSQTNRGVRWIDKPGRPERWKFDAHDNYVHTVLDIYAAYNQMGVPPEIVDSLIINTQEIAEKCFHKIPALPMRLPRVLDCPDSEEFDRFLKIVYDGYQRLNLPGTPEYIERLEREIKVLKDKEFIRYMLMVWDVVRWAKSSGIFVGPGRGSAGGSLVAYCMGITEVDPVRFRLFFERFIDPKRKEYPDIDVDFEDRNRHLIEEYLKSKYGAYSVAHISTFGAMLGRGAVRDVARLFEVPQDEVDHCSKHIIQRIDGAERCLQTIEDSIATVPEVKAFAMKYEQVMKHAQKLEGHVRGCGVHASGILVADEDLRTSPNCYLVKRNDKEEGDRKIAVNWDMNDVVHMGMIKLDVLGLSTLSAVSEALKLIKARHGIDIDMGRLRLDDKKTYEMVGRGETSTCFQLGTPGISRFCRELKPDNFEHLAAITALYRPGPLTSGGAEKYKRCKLGLEEPTYYNDAYKEVTEISYGQLIYQEQIAGLLMKLAGYSYEDADGVRKIVSKKLGPEEWAKHTDRFIQGCVKMKSLDEHTARQLWEKLSIFALYAFNRSHSVAYGLMAYQTAYLKANYPAEWICAYLNYGSAKKEDKKTGESGRDVALGEARRLGLQVLAPDINKSGVIWTVEDLNSRPALRVGLQDIHSVGPKAQEAIEKLKIQNGLIPTLDNFFKTVDRHAVNKSVVRSMLYVGALDGIVTGEERQYWLCYFDEMYESIGKPKKRESAKLLGLKPLDPAETEKRRAENLRFDPWSLDSKRITEELVEVLGDGFDAIETEEGDFIIRGDQRWLIGDVMNGIMKGASGVINLAPEVSIASIRKTTKACDMCELRKHCKAPVPGVKGQTSIMIVADAPGRDEDDDGKPLIGQGAEFLWRELEQYGISKDHVHVSNSIKCKPSKGVRPTLAQTMACPWFKKEMEVLKPKVVLAMGNGPLGYFTGREGGIMQQSGRTEYSHKQKCWVTYCTTPGSVVFGGQNDPDGGAARRAAFRSAVAEFARVVNQFA